MEYKFAKRMQYLKASEIREILKITERSDVISFAGGLPAPELFPIEAIKRVSQLVLDEQGPSALQYSTTEGYEPLRAWIAHRMNSRLCTHFKSENILLTHGSQQALDLSGKVFLDEEDVVLCESPTYLAAISAFKAYGCRFIEVPTDDEGMIPDTLEEILKNTKQVKLIYVIPEFQNPTGRTWSLNRIKQILQITQRHRVMLLEDNPYGELRFEGVSLPSMKAFDTEGCVLCLGTFSKTFCPGYRIGWIAGEKSVIEKYILVKQGADLQCNTLAQREIAKYLELYHIDEHIARIRAVYKKRRDAAVKTMKETFPEEVAFTEPNGGLFAWVELPAYINARDLLEACIRKNIVFVPGGSFFPNGGMENTLRINFSNMPEDKIIVGIKAIAEELKAFLQG